MRKQQYLCMFVQYPMMEAESDGEFKQTQYEWRSIDIASSVSLDLLS